MFDDQINQKPAGAPGNLPLGEPEDIFGAAPEVPSAPAARVEYPSVEERAPLPGSALSAGALRPRIASTHVPPPSVPPVMTPPPMIDEGNAAALPSAYPARGPRLSRVLMVIVIVVIFVGFIGGGGWYVYRFLTAAPALAPQTPGPVAPVAEPPPPAQEQPVPSFASGTPGPSTDEKVLFGGPVDSDGDGLSDYDEVNVHHTDPHNWDTDGDGLSDYDEVTIWHTDPHTTDTDRDGFTDGVEVKNGYNPSGPGKIFEPPKTAP